jgi:hypothetical protein
MMTDQLSIVNCQTAPTPPSSQCEYDDHHAPRGISAVAVESSFYFMNILPLRADLERYLIDINSGVSGISKSGYLSRIGGIQPKH